MKICKVIAKALLAVFIILIIAYSTVFFYMVAKDDDYSDPICIGEFRSSDIDKIELICNDEQILITNDDDISEIVSCFSKRVYVNTAFFDWASISGCGGLH